MLNAPTTELAPVDWQHDAATGEFKTTEGELLPFKFYPATRVFITSTGSELKIQSMIAEELFGIADGFRKRYRPEVPVIAIEYEAGKFTFEGNDNDSAYQDKLAIYNQDLGFYILVQTVAIAIENEPPPIDQWSSRLRLKLKAAFIDVDDPQNEARIKYSWIMDKLRHPAEVRSFTMIMQGSSLPTVEAIEDAESRFPSDGRNDGHQELPSETGAGELRL